MANEKFLEPEVAEALKRLREELRGRVTMEGPVLEVLFTAAGSQPIEHGLGETPTGVIVTLAYGGNVQATRVAEWSRDRAYLLADAVPTRARVYFVLTEAPTHA